MSTLVAKNVQVGTSGTATDNFTIRQPATPDGTVRIANGNSGTTTDLVTVTSAGNVGIGTSTPATPLEISGSGSTVNITATSAASYSVLRLRNTGASGKSYEVAVGGNTAAGGVANSWYVFDQGAGAVRFLIDTSGNVGVGTSSPGLYGINQRNLSISSTANNYAFLQLQGGTGGTTGGAIDFGDTSVRHAEIASLAGSSLAFYTNATNSGNALTERARIDSSGNLLVGTTAAISGNAPQVVVKTGTNTTPCYYAWNSATSGNNAFLEFGTESAYTGRGSITYNRGAGLVAYNTTSDYRAKDIIGPVTDSGAVIDSTPVYMGKMKGATQERPMFIAHEVPAYAHTGEKDAVDADGNPVFQQMDASSLVPVMWAEIQSLRARITALESK
jgi:hypothetical protein